MSQRKVKWGILSTANIGMKKVIPAMLKCANVEIVAISSRDGSKAKAAAQTLGIPHHYTDYQALLDNPEIEAIYNPMPHHLHFEWTKKAMQSGKHVLCEKPLTLDSNEINELIKIRDAHNVKVGEAFMVHTHPQWIRTKELIDQGEIGDLKAIQCFFSYNNVDPQNIRNIAEYGGGGMWDIGCYPIHTSRFVLGEEPSRVVSLIDRDPSTKVDRFASVIMEYPSCQCSFTVSTQLVPHQRMTFFGSKGKIEVEIPFNAPNDRECRIFLDDGDLFQRNRKEIIFDVCDQYTVQGEAFSESIIFDRPVPVSLEDAYKNVRVIEAALRSEVEHSWVKVR